MTVKREHTMHACATLKKHLPMERRARAAQNAGMKERTLRQRLESNVEQRSAVLDELGLWLQEGDITIEFFNDWLAPYGGGAYPIDGHEACLATSMKDGLKTHAEMACWAENGEFEQHEKRAGFRVVMRRISQLMGLANWMRKTANQKSPVYRA